jgi:hypothetical protein
MTVPLSGVSDVNAVTVSATGVIGNNTQTGTGGVTVGFLAGDVNGDRSVNAGDTVLTRSHAGVALDNTNFQYDVNVDGFVNVGDTVIVRSKSGDFLP